MSILILKKRYVVIILLILFLYFGSRKKSSKSVQKNPETLKKLFFCIENDKNIQKQIDNIGRNLYNETYKAEIKIIRKHRNGSFINSNLPQNFFKNRYRRVLCYDQSRVVLSTGCNSSDYINANYINSFNKKNAFILTQGNAKKNSLQ